MFRGDPQPLWSEVSSFVVPAEEIEFDRLEDIFTNTLVRIVLFGLASLAFFHGAHRFRHTLVDIGLRPLALPIAVVCYLTALVGTVWAATVAFG